MESNGTEFPAAGEPLSRAARRSMATDWRSRAASSVRAPTVALSASFLIVGFAVIVSGFSRQVLMPGGLTLSTAILWVGLVVATMIMFRQSRRPGLFAFQPTDAVFGLAVGLGLRLTQGLLSNSKELPFPTSDTGQILAGDYTASLWLGLGGLVGASIEELFFRAVVLVWIYQALRRRRGAWLAGSVAATVSALSFTLLHAIYGVSELDASVQLLIVGILCGLLVLATGRFWGAVIAHATYNMSYVALAVLGSLLA